ncbi:ankyrin repeat domain-containing protein [Paenibacillus sp. NPDC056579]|uniref:ankyrin repeat domain-containing protein n=1 Tax=Paenibacillus sp. NPDC056579 TaxID=3345871 RepID=UPI0036751769
MNDNICRAAANGNIETVKSLISSGIKASYECINCGHSLLNIAVENDQLEVIKFLLQNGADINFRHLSDDTNITLVHCMLPLR